MHRLPSPASAFTAVQQESLCAKLELAGSAGRPTRTRQPPPLRIDLGRNVLRQLLTGLGASGRGRICATSADAGGEASPDQLPPVPPCTLRPLAVGFSRIERHARATAAAVPAPAPAATDASPATAAPPAATQGRILTKRHTPSVQGGHDDADGNLIIREGDVFGPSVRTGCRYRVVELVGQGSFGTVVRCEVLPAQGAGPPGPCADAIDIPASIEALQGGSSSSDGASKRRGSTLPLPPPPSRFVAVKVVRNHPAYHTQAIMELHILNVLAKQAQAQQSAQGRPLVPPETSGGAGAAGAGNRRSLGRERGAALAAALAESVGGSSSTAGSAASSAPSASAGAAAAPAAASLPSPVDADAAGGSHVRLHDHFQQHSHICLVFEYLPLTLLHVVERTRFRGLPLPLVREFTRRVLLAVQSLHASGLAHADVKLENVMLGPATYRGAVAAPDASTTPSSPVPGGVPAPGAGDRPPSLSFLLRLIDFGSSSFEGSAGLSFPYVQSRFYRAPEAMLGLTYDGAIDMWSLGCLAAELFLGLPLFPGAHEYDQVTRFVAMLGWPPEHLLDAGSLTHRFFAARESSSSVASSGSGTGSTPPPLPLPAVVPPPPDAPLAFHTRLSTYRPARPSVSGSPTPGVPGTAGMDATGPSDRLPFFASQSPAASAMIGLAGGLARWTPARPPRLTPWGSAYRLKSLAEFEAAEGRAYSKGRQYYPFRTLDAVVAAHDQRVGLIPGIRSAPLSPEPADLIGMPWAVTSVAAAAASQAASSSPAGASEAAAVDSSAVRPAAAPLLQLDDAEAEARLVFADFLSRLLCWDPRTRMTAAQALVHPFILGPTRAPGSAPDEGADAGVVDALLRAGLTLPVLTRLAAQDSDVRVRRAATAEANTRRAVGMAPTRVSGSLGFGSGDAGAAGGADGEGSKGSGATTRAGAAVAALLSQDSAATAAAALAGAPAGARSSLPGRLAPGAIAAALASGEDGSGSRDGSPTKSGGRGSGAKGSGSGGGSGGTGDVQAARTARPRSLHLASWKSARGAEALLGARGLGGAFPPGGAATTDFYTLPGGAPLGAPSGYLQMGAYPPPPPGFPQSPGGSYYSSGGGYPPGVGLPLGFPPALAPQQQPAAAYSPPAPLSPSALPAGLVTGYFQAYGPPQPYGGGGQGMHAGVGQQHHLPQPPHAVLPLSSPQAPLQQHALPPQEAPQQPAPRSGPYPFRRMTSWPRGAADLAGRPVAGPGPQGGAGEAAAPVTQAQGADRPGRTLSFAATDVSSHGTDEALDGGAVDAADGSAASNSPGVGTPRMPRLSIPRSDASDFSGGGGGGGGVLNTSGYNGGVPPQPSAGSDSPTSFKGRRSMSGAGTASGGAGGGGEATPADGSHRSPKPGLLPTPPSGGGGGGGYGQLPYGDAAPAAAAGWWGASPSGVGDAYGAGASPVSSSGGVGGVIAGGPGSRLSLPRALAYGRSFSGGGSAIAVQATGSNSTSGAPSRPLSWSRGAVALNFSAGSEESFAVGADRSGPAGSGGHSGGPPSRPLSMRGGAVPFVIPSGQLNVGMPYPAAAAAQASSSSAPVYSSMPGTSVPPSPTAQVVPVFPPAGAYDGASSGAAPFTPSAADASGGGSESSSPQHPQQHGASPTHYSGGAGNRVRTATNSMAAVGEDGAGNTDVDSDHTPREERPPPPPSAPAVGQQWAPPPGAVPPPVMVPPPPPTAYYGAYAPAPGYGGYAPYPAGYGGYAPPPPPPPGAYYPPPTIPQLSPIHAQQQEAAVAVAAAAAAAAAGLYYPSPHAAAAAAAAAAAGAGYLSPYGGYGVPPQQLMAPASAGYAMPPQQLPPGYPGDGAFGSYGGGYQPQPGEDGTGGPGADPGSRGRAGSFFAQGP